MATIILNPLIISITGRFGDVVFYVRKGKQCLRTHVIPYNPDTELQKTKRRSFADAVRSWQVLPADIKSRFNKKAKSTGMSGYNLYISEYLKKCSSLQVNYYSKANGTASGIYRFPSVSYPYHSRIQKKSASRTKNIRYLPQYHYG